MRWKTAHTRRRRLQQRRARDRAFAAAIIRHVVDLFGLRAADLKAVQGSVALAVATGGTIKVFPPAAVCGLVLGGECVIPTARRRWPAAPAA